MSETTTETAARPYPDIWARESATPVVERYHSAVRALVAERFAAAGYAAVVFDYRGFGDSEGEPAS